MPLLGVEVPLDMRSITRTTQCSMLSKRLGVVHVDAAPDSRKRRHKSDL